MKSKIAVFLLLFSALGFGQGAYTGQQTALKVVNGYTMPIANAIITVCGPNASGIPCAPPLTNAVFRDAALTQPQTNPFFADASGNYNFAIAPGNYTVTVTASGFSGNSYQITVQCTPGNTCVFSGPVNFSGGTLNGNYAGNPNFTGNPVFSGGATVSGSFTPSGNGQITANSLYLANSSVTAPSPVGSSTNCRPGVNPFLWTKDGSGNYEQAAGIDTGATIAIGSTNTEKGFLSFCRPVLFNVSGIDPAGSSSFIYNGALNIYARPASGTNIGMMGAQILTDDSPSDSATYGSGFRGLYSEVDINGNPAYSGIDTGAHALRGTTVIITASGTVGSNNAGVSGFGQHLSNAVFPSCGNGGCVMGGSFQVSDNGTGNVNGAVFESLRTFAAFNGSSTNVGLEEIHIVPPSNAFPTFNAGLGIDNFGSASQSFNFDSGATASEQGRNYLEGKTLINHVQTGGVNRSIGSVLPTCSSTGTGTGPSCALDTGSNDSSGTLTVTAGTTPGASGTITLTYNATYGTNSTTCIMMASNAGTGAWDARVSLRGGTMNTTSAVVNWDNNAVNLTAASTYKVNYHCFAK